MKITLQTIRNGLSAFALGASVAAQAAAPVITNITVVAAKPRFSIRSDVGVTNLIQYSTNLSHTNWLVLTNPIFAMLLCCAAASTLATTSYFT